MKRFHLSHEEKNLFHFLQGFLKLQMKYGSEDNRQMLPEKEK